jgi:UV DNA damage endonuclease
METVQGNLMFHRTWRRKDGIPMVDYSSPRLDGRKGSHADSIDLKLFTRFLEETRLYDLDIMLEIKDKEHSALKVVALVRGDGRSNKTMSV